MRRNGTVTAMNLDRGMVGIATEDDGFTNVELLSSWDLDVGDEIAWTNGHGLGSEVCENLSKGTRCTVFVQNHSVSPTALRQQLFL
jgi:hypothetical protein